MRTHAAAFSMTKSTIEIETRATEEIELDPRRWAALAVVLGAAFLAVLDFFIVNISIPSIQSDLHASDSQVQLMIAGYGLAYAVCLITGGRLGDIYGRKRLFLIGTSGFTLASMLCGLARNPEQLIAARVFQGLLAAMMFPQVISIIQVSFAPAERALAYGIFGGVAGTGSFAGNVLGGWLIGANLWGLSWRPVFFVNLPVGLLALACAVPLLRESCSSSARKLDLPGVLISGAGLFLLIFPISEGRERGWPLWAFACITSSFLILWFFVRFESRVSQRGGAPLVELRLFLDRAFSTGLTGAFTFFSSIGAFALMLTVFLQDGLKLSPARTGWTFAPFAVGFLSASLAAVPLARRFGNRVISGGLLMMLGGLCTVMWLVFSRGVLFNPLDLLPVLLVYGAGQGFTLPALTALILSGVSDEDAGSASGVLTTVQQIALALGVALIGGVFYSVVGLHPQPASYARALPLALVCNFVLLCATFGLVLRMPQPVSGLRDVVPEA